MLALSLLPLAVLAAEEPAGDHKGLIRQYPLEGNCGDRSPSACQGIAHGNVQFVPGRTGKCAALDGNSWIDTGLMQKDLGLEFTVECWLNPAPAQHSFAGIFGNETVTGNGFTLDQWESQSNAFTANFGVGGGQYVRTDTVVLQPGVWHHVAYVKTVQGNIFYLNGIPVAEVSDNRPMAPSPGAVQAGRGGNNVPCFQGLIDEVRIWNRAVTDFRHAGIDAELTTATLASRLAIEVKSTASPANSGTVQRYQAALPDRFAQRLPVSVAQIPISVVARRMNFNGTPGEERSLPVLALERSAEFRTNFSLPEHLAPGCWNVAFTSRLAMGDNIAMGKPASLTLVVPPRPQDLQPQSRSESVPAAELRAQSRRLELGWRILTDPDNKGRQEEWFRHVPAQAKPAYVPGSIQQVFPGYHGVAWYWIEFEGLGFDAKRYAGRLRFESVDHYAEVWLNGQRLGDHEGADFPCQFNATSALRLGRNLLAVRVINPGNTAVDGFKIGEVPHSFKTSDHYHFGGNANSGGLLLPVELRIEPVVRVSDVYCRTEASGGKVSLQLTIENITQHEVACHLSAALERQNSGQGWVECAAGAELTAPPGFSEFALPLTVPHPKRWSPREPNLYWASVRLQSELSDGGMVHERRERFGFRDFRVGQDGYFRLNGQRLFLKSCHTVNNFPVAIGTAHKPEMATRDLLYAKAMGYDMVRFLGGPPLPEQFRFCDEIGLMIYAEPRASWCLADSPWMAERFNRSLAQMILFNRNHPCVTIWGLLNETGDGPVFRQAVASLPLVRALDDTRLVLLASGRWEGRLDIGSLCNPGSTAWECLWGDESLDAASGKGGQSKEPIPGDVHRYVWWPGPAGLRTLGGASKPVFLSEYGVGSLVNCIRLARLHEQDGSAPELKDFAAYRAMSKQLALDLKRFGLDGVFAFPEDLLRASEMLQGKHRTLGYNAIRSNPKLCGYSLTGIIDQPAGEGLLTEWRELKLGTMDALNDCLAPLRWCLFVEPMHVYAGRTFRIEAVMANDGVLRSGEYPVRYKIAGPQGIIWEKVTRLVVPAADAPDQIPLAIPALIEDITINGPTGAYTFAADLEHGGAARGGRLEFHLSNADDQPKMDHAVAVVGIREEVQTWLKARGVACQPIDQTPAPDNAIILVGDGPGTADRARLWQELARRMARGSVLVFLKPSGLSEGSDPVRWLPLQKKGECRRSSLWVYHREDVSKRHPIFDGLPAGGIMDPYYFLQVTPQVLFGGQEPPDDVAAAAFAPGCEQVEGNVGRSGIITGSYRFGSGHFVLNTLRILENLDKNPAADRLLLNLILYAKSLVKLPAAALPSDFDSILQTIGYK